MQKIYPYLWFENNVEEAVKFYTSIFKNTEIGDYQYYEESMAEVSGQPAGSILSINFKIEGLDFAGLNGGPLFKFSPAVSFFVTCDTEEEINGLWTKLSEGGKVLMEFQKYPFSEKYGWCEDKFGVSWQLSLGKSPQKIVPSLLFVGDKAGKAEEAMNFYAGLFDNSKIETVARYEAGEHDVEGTVKYSLFSLDGCYFTAMDSSSPDHKFNFTQAISFLINCKDQVEIDKFWNAFKEGGQEQQCGWIIDKYGVPWQVVPADFEEIMKNAEPEKRKRMLQAMLTMHKLDIAGLKNA